MVGQSSNLGCTLGCDFRLEAGACCRRNGQGNTDVNKPMRQHSGFQGIASTEHCVFTRALCDPLQRAPAQTHMHQTVNCTDVAGAEDLWDPAALTSFTGSQSSLNRVPSLRHVPHSGRCHSSSAFSPPITDPSKCLYSFCVGDHRVSVTDGRDSNKHELGHGKASALAPLGCSSPTRGQSLY